MARCAEAHLGAERVTCKATRIGAADISRTIIMISAWSLGPQSAAAARHLLIPTKISGADVLTAIEAGTGGTSGIAWDIISSDTKLFWAGQHLVYGSVSTAGLQEEDGGWAEGEIA